MRFPRGLAWPALALPGPSLLLLLILSLLFCALKPSSLASSLSLGLRVVALLAVDEEAPDDVEAAEEDVEAPVLLLCEDDDEDGALAKDEVVEVAQRAFLRIKLVTWVISPSTSVASETSQTLPDAMAAESMFRDLDKYRARNKPKPTKYGKSRSHYELELIVYGELMSCVLELQCEDPRNKLKEDIRYLLSSGLLLG